MCPLWVGRLFVAALCGVFWCPVPEVPAPLASSCLRWFWLVLQCPESITLQTLKVKRLFLENLGREIKTRFGAPEIYLGSSGTQDMRRAQSNQLNNRSWASLVRWSREKVFITQNENGTRKQI